MNQYLKVLALTILVLYTVNTQSATIDQQITDLRTQIADKIKQQETLMSQRVASITATSSKFNELKSIEAELLQARVAAETSYKAYFNEQTRCDGLKGVSVLDTQTSISGDAPCLKAPLGPESIDLAMKRFQVSSFDVDVYAAQQILDQQNNFIKSSQSLYNAYLELARYYSEQKFLATQNYSQCRYQNMNQSGLEPVQCKQKLDIVIYYSNALYEYNFQRIMLERAVPANGITADNKKYELDTAKSTQTAMQATLQSSVDQVGAILNICLENAALLRTQANQRISDFTAAQAKLDAKKAEITQDLNDYDVKLQALADSINQLGAQVIALEKQK